MTIHIVLVHPKIPNNTGSAIRLCANTGAQLHLVEPLGFDLDDKKLRRAGLDYHEYAAMQVHKNWQVAKEALQAAGCHKMVALTTKLSHPFYEYDFGDSNAAEHESIALVFGSETAGLADDIRADIGESNWLRLPMLPDSRSLNLANSISICLYEVWRQKGFYGDEGRSTGYTDLTPYDPK
ncbi:tRNA (cytidine(34)-2'-O)-methyltransferase [Psychrobacter sanguinis]|uniref:tRNA (cytidine(34)-2'-O)-methyltransferase n=1 Tax=Psychrobacter sanguinis TaxID=861445 RepID=A0A844LZI7_9GAMM|nr:tRNA (cytidine(34)-2'-O)-methyltransferase [Psychrobacter sanguinis]MUG31830.1 tRNA (uridine(34)/cytosine(34)/5-carboxymethylaminomethyluridine(34)-2'-O)-methyltransferase TrmL [Psychrobacter sanguinis]